MGQFCVLLNKTTHLQINATPVQTKLWLWTSSERRKNRHWFISLMFWPYMTLCFPPMEQNSNYSWVKVPLK